MAAGARTTAGRQVPAQKTARAKAAPVKKTTARKVTPAKASPAKRAPQAKAAAKPAPAKKTAARKAAVKTQRYQIDDRLTGMSGAALMCRSWGHAPVMLSVPPTRKMEIRDRGQRIRIIGCSNGCGRTRTIIMDRGSAEVISDRTKYEDPKGYLVQKTGAGRVPRQNSRQAFFAMVDDD